MKTGNQSASSYDDPGLKRFRWYEALSTVGYIGYLPFAPGTWGSLVAAVVWYLFIPVLTTQTLIMATIVLFFVGISAADKTEKAFNVNDPGSVVIDEWVGQWIACWFLPQSILYGFIAFASFRLFDIWKPWPIRKLDRLAGGLGIMLDDVAAGAFALAVTQLFYWGLK